MSRVFADTHSYIALLSRRDADHVRAEEFLSQGKCTEVVTTVGVLLELADGMSGVRERESCARFVAGIRASGTTKLISLSDEIVERGLALYRSRVDKEWSLTDCNSFVVMADEGLTDALTGDRHFEQAGFVALLA
ncbi:MAG: PIN domain-containing protein [Chthoniobacteraceae bacterium]